MSRLSFVSLLAFLFSVKVFAQEQASTSTTSSSTTSEISFFEEKRGVLMGGVNLYTGASEKSISGEKAYGFDAYFEAFKGFFRPFLAVGFHFKNDGESEFFGSTQKFSYRYTPFRVGAHVHIMGNDVWRPFVSAAGVIGFIDMLVEPKISDTTSASKKKNYSSYPTGYSFAVGLDWQLNNKAKYALFRAQAGLETVSVSINNKPMSLTSLNVQGGFGF